MKKYNILLGSAALLALTSGVALASNAADGAGAHQKSEAAPAAPQAFSGPVLEQVVVTAQRRTETAQKAPIPIDVISGDALAQAGVNTATELSSKLPALDLSQGSGGNQVLYIRGVGTLSGNSYTDPGVAVNVDGVYIGRPSSFRDVFYDLQRVEVLKGPQGTLYGRNATGGAINIIPNIPDLNKFSGDIGLTLGNYNDIGLEGFVNVPFSDTVAGRVAFTRETHDGYLSDGTDDADRYAIRAQVLWQPSDDVTFRLSGDYAHEGGNGTGSSLLAYLNPFTLQPTISPQSRAIGFRDPRTNAILSRQYDFLSGRFASTIPYPAFRDDYLRGITGHLNWHTDMGDLTVIAGYRNDKVNTISFDLGSGFYSDQRSHQTSVEARFASPSTGLFRWIVGAYYYDEGIDQLYAINLQDLASYQSLTTGTKSVAGFGNVTIAPTKRLRFTAGVRVTHDSKPFDGVSNYLFDICKVSGVIPACPSAPYIPYSRTRAGALSALHAFPVAPNVYVSPLPGAGNTIFTTPSLPENAKTSLTKATWKVGVNYDLAPQSLLYATYATGYHAGGFAFSRRKPTFGPEEIAALTIGSKNRFFGGRLQVNLEAFRWKYKDEQVTHFSNDPDGSLVYITENIGESTNQGAELSVSARPFLYTTLNFDVQYLDAKYDNFVYTAPTTSGPVVTGCGVTYTSATEASVDCSGHAALRSPRWTLNESLQQVFPVGDYNIIFNASSRFQSSSYIGFQMIPGASQQKAYTMTNVSLSFGPATDKWLIQVFANNLENERVVGVANFSTSFNIFTGVPSPPRTFGARLNVKW